MITTTTTVSEFQSRTLIHASDMEDIILNCHVAQGVSETSPTLAEYIAGLRQDCKEFVITDGLSGQFVAGGAGAWLIILHRITTTSTEMR